MARRRRLVSATFEDLPAELEPRERETREVMKARWDWLESHDLSVFDYIGWRREQLPGAALRPPGRRRQMTPDALAELDTRLEREGIRPTTTTTPKEVRSR